MARRLCTLLVIAALVTVSACTVGDGEGPRYIGRVVSVGQDEICVGPNSSSDEITCGSIPTDPPPLPEVGECFALFSKIGGDGQQRTWTGDSLRRDVDQDRCDR